MRYTLFVAAILAVLAAGATCLVSAATEPEMRPVAQVVAPGADASGALLLREATERQRRRNPR